MARTADVVQLRKRRKQRKLFFKCMLVMIVLVFGGLIYATRDKWYAKLEQIGTRNISGMNTETDGEFMLKVSGGVEYHADFVNNDLFVLCDKYLYIYGTDGELKDSRQHAYSNAVMKTNHNKVLTYSFNGTMFRVDNKNKMLYENDMKQPIWFAVLSEDGYAAVVTESETYACRLSVFDAAGKLIYTRECVERLTDVSFVGSTGCIFSTIGAENGEIVTVLQYIQFNDSEVHWITNPLPTLGWHLYTAKDGGAFVIGDTKAAYYDNTGALISTYDYNGTLTDCDCENNQAAVLLHNEDRRQSTLLLFSDENSSPVSVSFDSICKNVRITDNTVYLLDVGTIRSYSFYGTEISTLKVNDVFDGILRNGKYFYLLGYDRIQRINAS